MGWTKTKRKTPEQTSLALEGLTPKEVKIIDILRSRGQTHIDILSALTEIPQPELASILLTMEFKDLINSYPGKKFEAR